MKDTTGIRREGAEDTVSLRGREIGGDGRVIGMGVRGRGKNCSR